MAIFFEISSFQRFNNELIIEKKKKWKKIFDFDRIVNNSLLLLKIPLF